MKVLIVENNHELLQQLYEILDKEGYHPIKAEDGTQALEIYRRELPDFICLDILMPGMSGYDVCKEIRRTDTKTPIIFISSKSQTIDKVLGLEVGADDYIVKPFDVIEVIARIRAVARRCLSSKQKVDHDGDQPFMIGTIQIIPNELRAKKGDRTIDLSLRDIKILRLFFDNKGKLIDRNTLLDHCWGIHIMPESRTVDWHISQLRKKIEDDPAQPILIKTLHGAGYKYE